MQQAFFAHHRGLVSQPVFGFASRMAQKRIYVQKQQTFAPASGLHLAFPGEKVRPANMKIKESLKRARFTNQPTPVNDFINFK